MVRTTIFHVEANKKAQRNRFEFHILHSIQAAIPSEWTLYRFLTVNVDNRRTMDTAKSNRLWITNDKYWYSFTKIWGVRLLLKQDITFCLLNKRTPDILVELHQHFLYYFSTQAIYEIFTKNAKCQKLYFLFLQISKKGLFSFRLDRSM